ncbi:MAG: CHAT domain-containing protein [Deltaproteobacteria bacterium]|nr:CHAT domain-containing protein [Deltaproteobacteria bacterium]
MTGKKDDDLQALLEERQRIDRALEARHRGERVILFTDIVGSTELFERKGDIEGLAFVQRHNDLLFPLVEEHQGRIVKTIGDAIMAVFEAPAMGVACAARMQQVLREDRAAHPEADAIHIRIGVHLGAVMLADGDVFGDAVNTAARIEAKGQADEVLISAKLFEALPAGSVQAEPCGGVPLKGKAELVPVMALHWGEGTPAARRLDPGPREAAPATPEITGSTQALPPLLVLDLMEGGRGLKAAVMDGEQDKGPVRTFAEGSWGRADADKILRRFDAFLGGNASSYASKVRTLGELLWNGALPASVRARLETTERGFLRLQVDEAFADVPWELLHDGRTFLGLRFAVGRVIATSATGSAGPGTAAEAEGAALIVADPCGDLPSAREEGGAVAGLLHEGFGGEVVHLTGPVTRADLLGALSGVRVMHFAGHVRWQEGARGLAMADGVVGAREIVEACGERPPSLVFANSCHSGGQGEWRGGVERERGLASALLLSGVRHYLGPTGPVRDADALRFALRFWEAMLAGERYGEAVRLAKLRLVEADPKSLSFARYQLYGEPRSALPPALARKGEGATRTAGGTSTSLPAAHPDFAAPEVPWYRQKWLLAGLGAVLVATLQFWVRQAWRSWEEPIDPGVAATAAATPPSSEGGAAGGAPKKEPEAEVPRTGPISVIVVPFKDLGGTGDFAFLADALAEQVMTDFGAHEELHLYEKPQLDAPKEVLQDYQTSWYDPEHRVPIGKFFSSEVVVVGSFQSFGGKLRVLSRFVHVETGEILETVKVDGAGDDPFTLQDTFAAEVSKIAPRLVEKLR